jgi:hypothetical protein
MLSEAVVPQHLLIRISRQPAEPIQATASAAPPALMMRRMMDLPD